MSTGENINAGGMVLSQSILRVGFQKFPQTDRAWVNPAQWPQIPPLQVAVDYPFKASPNAAVPMGQVWFVGTSGELLGRIVNIAP